MLVTKTGAPTSKFCRVTFRVVLGARLVDQEVARPATTLFAVPPAARSKASCVARRSASNRISRSSATTLNRIEERPQIGLGLSHPSSS